VNKIQQKKPLGLNLGKQKQAKILLSQSDKKEIRAFLKNVGSNFILKDKN